MSYDNSRDLETMRQPMTEADFYEAMKCRDEERYNTGKRARARINALPDAKIGSYSPAKKTDKRPAKKRTIYK